ncbi:MAG TPA: ATP-binding protein, partial [Blastocatellia bacterium]|nr:ATP-binding protein [Blastocatellia bacterium]HMZ16771.1 ATP-binding protein [Blastocatellia bacterium]HNG28273.1 ATP-binding protein [Blastocatellia bacterium]
MSTTAKEQNEFALSVAEGDDNPRKAKALQRLIQRGQGRFVLALVEFDLPSKQTEIFKELRANLSELNLVTVKLSPLPRDDQRGWTVLDQLQDLVKLYSPDKAPDALIVTGYETLLADNLKRAVQPLNLGRNLFAKTFPCPVLLCLPPKAMSEFMSSAPDLSSWQSGFFKFESDLDAVRRRLQQESRKSSNWFVRWRLRRQLPDRIFDQTDNLKACIADAEALPADAELTARLYQRLGWTAVALGDRVEARKAFEKVQQLAGENQRLVRNAQRGERIAETLTLRDRIALPQSEAAQRVFRGAAALTDAEGLYGREKELDNLITRALSVATRFLTIWGETGCGKTSIVMAGLLPAMEKEKSEATGESRYLPVVVRQWDEPETRIHEAIEAAGPTADPPTVRPTLHDAVKRLAEQSGKTIVIVCDQFEQFFTTHTDFSRRAPLLKAIGQCLKDYRISCKFLFIIRQDHLGQMVEFELDKDAFIAEPLQYDKRFHLPLFSAADAARALGHQVDRAGLDWPDKEGFIKTVIADLTHEDRVRPIEMQLIGAALAASGINTQKEFAREGRSEGLMVEYLRLTLNSLKQNKASVRTMRQMLLALVGEPARRLALTAEQIANRANVKLSEVHRLLRLLLEHHLVRRIGDLPGEQAAATEADALYELMHDELVNLTLIMTRDLQDKRRQATRVLVRALEDLKLNPRHTITLREWNLVRDHGGASDLKNPKVKALLRRSLLRGALTKIILPLLMVAATIIFVRQTFSYVSIEQDFNDRVVIRRGLPWLGILGRDVLIDTGYSAARTISFRGETSDVKQDERALLQGTWAWQRDNQYGELLRKNGFIGHLGTLPVEGLLLCQTGQIKAGFEKLVEALKTNNNNLRDAAGNTMKQMAQVTPEAALTALLELLKQTTPGNDPSGYVRSAAAAAIGQAAAADPKAALTALLELLKQTTPGNDP